MANVYVTERGRPRKTRNGSIYQGYSFVTNNQYVTGAGSGSGGSAQRHIEAGKVQDITDRSVSVEFLKPFINLPIGASFITVTRIVYEPAISGYVRQNVLHYFPNGSTIYSTTGFSLTIDPGEDLTGVIIEYLFTE